MYSYHVLFQRSLVSKLFGTIGARELLGLIVLSGHVTAQVTYTLESTVTVRTRIHLGVSTRVWWRL